MTHKILVVEDEIKLADYLNKGLAEEGFTVDVAHNGKIVVVAIIPLLLQKRIDQLVILFGEPNLPFAQRSELC